MNWDTRQIFKFKAGDVCLEGRCIGPPPEQADTLVLLHEGLGCIELWREFPERLARASGYGVFVYSRRGYGGSDAVNRPRPLDYMTREALDSLPEVLGGIGLRRGVLLGHSDGASIAALYAGLIRDSRLTGLVLLAPHFFTEAPGLAAIVEAGAAFASGDLRSRMARYHQDVDGAFRGWNDAWLDPGFRDWNIEHCIPGIQVPVLAIQGRQDQYGSRLQIEALEQGLASPLKVVMLDDCRHSPFIDQPQATLEHIAGFVRGLGQFSRA